MIFWIKIIGSLAVLIITGTILTVAWLKFKERGKQ